MKQKKLVKEVLNACLTNDNEKLYDLRLEEFKKILKHKEKNKPFSIRRPGYFFLLIQFWPKNHISIIWKRTRVG